MSRILIVHPEGNINDNPNLYSLVRELVRRGSKVTVMARRYTFKYQDSNTHGATVIFFQDTLKKISALMKGFSCIIGVDEGLIVAAKYAKMLNVPYAFLSYEILFDNEINKLNNTFKRLEKRLTMEACEEIDFCIAQDKIRRDLLMREYRIKNKPCILMPVAGSGSQMLQRNQRLHDQLNIPYNKKILLYMGMMKEGLRQRLAAYGENLPDDWTIVIHSRYKYETNVKSDNKIYFSFDNPVEDINDIGVLLSDCDAGFCSYLPDYATVYTGDNIKYVGMSSGKTSTFLQYGIPIVVENMNIWEEIVEKEGIGIRLGKPEDLNRLNSLTSPDMQYRCMKFFDEKLDIKNCTQVFSAISGTKRRKESFLQKISSYIKLSYSIAKEIAQKTT